MLQKLEILTKYINHTEETKGKDGRIASWERKYRPGKLYEENLSDL